MALSEEENFRKKLLEIVSEENIAILGANPGKEIDNETTHSINTNITQMNLKDIDLTVEDLEERKKELLEIVGYKENEQPKGTSGMARVLEKH